jgi:signal transduction histidine kinase
MNLYSVLARRRGEIIGRWKELVQGKIAPGSMSPLELVDSLPQFLDEMTAWLRNAELENKRERRTAAVHGEQRLRLGFSLDAVVREYGLLRRSVLETAEAAGVTPSYGELEILFDAIVEGIADAVSEYSRQRDAEQQRQHNEHFAFIAHELRNPLSACTTALELLKRKNLLPADAKPAAVLERGLGRMRETIEHALEVARIGSGITVHREPTRLSKLFEEVELAASTEAEKRSIAMRVRLQDDDEVWLDERLILSALGNLVRNAVKYSMQGREVELRGRIRCGRALIEVEDSCGGLPPGTVERAFAPFVRFHAQESGFGLGLSIAKQAMDAHGGAIRVQNIPGKGCIFALDVPIERPA